MERSYLNVVLVVSSLLRRGHAFLPAVRQALQTVEESVQTLFGDGKENTLILQATMPFSNGWLAPRLPEFSRRNPNIQMHLTAAYRDQDFRRAGAELQILFGPVHRSWAQCDRLFDELVYPVATPEIAESIHSVEDLLHYRLIQISTHRVNWNQILHAAAYESIPTRQLCFTEGHTDGNGDGSRRVRCCLSARSPTTDDLLEKFGLVACQEIKGPG